jgi:Ni,Fe-hydrogenase III large subunit
VIELRREELAPADIGRRVAADCGRGARLMSLFAIPCDGALLELVALLFDGGEVRRLATPVAAEEGYPSLTRRVPAAHWYEREIHDLHGVVPAGHPRLEPLVHHVDGNLLAERGGLEHRGHERLGGPGVFLIPYGPVRSGVFETAQFLVQTSGEDVAYCAQRLFFKRRGAERRICDVPIEHSVLVAERVSGTSSVAHAIAFCEGTEALAEVQAPPLARAVRSLLAEVERIYNHLEVVVRECEDASLTVGQAQFAALKERLHRLAAELTGNRYLRGVVVPGGIAVEFPGAMLSRLGETLADWEGDYDRALKLLMETDSFLDRLITAGPLSEADARDFGCVGPVARGSGISVDVRRDLPYAGYAALEVDPPLGEDGDAMSRLEVRFAEIRTSLSLIRELAADLPPGDRSVPIAGFRREEAIGCAESARGEIVYYLRAGESPPIDFCHIRTASFANFGIFNRVFEGQVLTDFAFIEHSLGLSPAGCDR